MTVLTVDFKTNHELKQERDSLVERSGMSLDELTSRGEDYQLTVDQYAIFEAISDINYLLGE